MQLPKPHWCFIFVFGISATTVAQRDHYGKNLHNYEYEKLHAGTHLGINFTTYSYRIKSDLPEDDSLYSMSIRGGPGFNINVPMMAWSPIYNIHIRANASISFHETSFEYSYWKKGELKSKLYRTDPTRLNFPVQLKLNANRINNFGAYALGGFCYSYDLGSQHKAIQNDSDPIVKMKPADYAYEVGGGFDFFLEYFKFGMELKLQQGLRDILIHDDSFYARPIESMKSRIWWFSFTFET